MEMPFEHMANRWDYSLEFISAVAVSLRDVFSLQHQLQGNFFR